MSLSINRSNMLSNREKKAEKVPLLENPIVRLAAILATLLFLFGTAASATQASDIQDIGADISERLNDLEKSIPVSGVDDGREQTLMAGIESLRQILKTIIMDIEDIVQEQEEASKRRLESQLHKKAIF
ncbi:MAG: hypothetical protein ACR2QF_00940 [Geminicoccaceae bacterium]